MWFETLTGFREKSPQQVRENISVDGNILKLNWGLPAGMKFYAEFTKQ